MNDKIKSLQREIEREEQKMRNCNHSFGDSFENYETQREEYLTGQYETQGRKGHFK
jgi:hypothetical protein